MGKRNGYCCQLNSCVPNHLFSVSFGSANSKRASAMQQWKVGWLCLECLRRARYVGFVQSVKQRLRNKSYIFFKGSSGGAGGGVIKSWNIKGGEHWENWEGRSVGRDRRRSRGGSGVGKQWGS